ncbi:MAG: c-type cytochrome [Chitinophagaceae bacterium]|jgi:cytochrome c peroxidase|nr:c-type cytochrome [Chitinophagaceae bacterium]
MKKGVFLMLCVIAMGCSPREEKQAGPARNPARDTALWKQAHGFFAVLPAVAETESNTITDAKVKLGQVLFYDPRISKSGKSSCNSCHRLSSWGVDNVKASADTLENPTQRNAPTVFNAALHNMQFWDGRALTIEEQAGKPLLNQEELAVPHLGFLVNRLRNDSMYRSLFNAAFPGEIIPVSYTNLQKAIGAFERTLLTPSRFDKYMAGDLTALTIEEQEGLAAFMDAGCASCHNGVGVGGGSLQRFGIFTDYRTLTHSRMDDEGRLNITGDHSEKDKFKVPGLRNVEMTYPYFHDGSIANLDSSVKIMAATELNRKMTSDEVGRIVAFLKTMTGDIRDEAKKVPPELASLQK